MIINTIDLKNALKKIGGVVNYNSTLPILENIVFRAKDNILTLIAGNERMTAKTELKVESDIEFLAEARTLLQLINNIQDTTVEFILDANAVRLKTHTGEYSIPTENIDDYIQLKTKEEDFLFFIDDIKDLTDGLKRVSYATSKDELRPALGCVNFIIERNRLSLVTTDAFRLAYDCRLNVGAEDAEFLIPKASLNVLSHLEGKVKVLVSDVDATFVDENNTSYRMTLESQPFPEWRAITPDHDLRLELNNHSLLMAIRRVGLMTSKNNNMVVLEIKDDKLIVSGEDVEFSKQGEEIIYLDREDYHPMRVGLNAKLLLEMLSVLDDEILFLYGTEKNKPILLQNNDDYVESNGFHLLMPLMLRD